MKTGWIKTIFIISGIYDGGLGVIFLVAGMPLFDLFNVTRPNHIGYIQFPALILIIFGVMFLRIAGDPYRFRELIWYGAGLKLAYSGVVFYHYFTAGLPFMWVPFAILDLLFLILYMICWASLRRPVSTADIPEADYFSARSFSTSARTSFDIGSMADIYFAAILPLLSTRYF